jgi:hypothetical protein
MKNLFFALLFCLWTFGADSCFGDFIIVNSTSTLLATSSGNTNFTKERVITDLSATEPGLEHEETYYSNAWIGELNTSDLTKNHIDYFFQDPTAQLVERISFWNITDVSSVFLSGGAHEDTSLDASVWNRNSGLKDFKLHRRENSSSSWVEIGSFTLNQTLNTDQYFDSTYGDLYFAREQQIQFVTPFLANAVKVEFLSNYGNGNKIGLADVNFFSSSAVPEPTSLFLLGGSTILVGAYKRLRRKRKPHNQVGT